jgi:hypothetical protein
MTTERPTTISQGRGNQTRGNGYQRPLNSKSGLTDVNLLASGVLGYVSNSLGFCASADGYIKLEPVKQY